MPVRTHTRRRRLTHGPLLVAAALIASCGELGVESELEPAISALTLGALPSPILETDTLTLSVAVVGPSGLTLDSLRAISSNPAVATVTANRISRSVSLIARSAGIAEVELVAYGTGPRLRPTVERTGALITVGALPAACSAVALQLPRSPLWVGESLQVTSSLTRASASVLTIGDRFASSDISVAEISSNGVVRGLRIGTAELSFNTTCSGPRLRTLGVEARHPVSVTNETIALGSSRDSAKLGRTGRYVATVGNLRPGGTTEVMWESRNANVAAVSNDGSWRAIAAGRTYLVARSTSLGAARDSIEFFVDSGCSWLFPYRIGDTRSGDLIGGGLCSLSERFELVLSSPTVFELTLSASSGGSVRFTKEGGFNGGWPTVAPSGRSSLDPYALSAGRHVFRLDSENFAEASFTLTSRSVDSARCAVKVVRGVSASATIDEQCPELAIFVVDETAAGTRTTIRVSNAAFPPEVELIAWDPTPRVAARATGNPGATTVVDYTATAGMSLNALVRSRSAARGSMTITVDP
jgi:hypothetical protein